MEKYHMSFLLSEALSNYEFINPRVSLICHNENMTYYVEDSVDKYLLRIHKHKGNFDFEVFVEDMHSLSKIKSEMLLLDRISKYADINVQKPIANTNGEYVTVLADGTAATLLEWIEGKTLNKVEITENILYGIGVSLGKLHKFFKAEVSKLKMDRKIYDSTMLKSMRKCIHKGVIYGSYTEEQYSIINEALNELSKRLKELDQMRDVFGFVHTDLSKSNFIINTKNEIVPIDFCLSGYGYYYHDLGALFKHFRDVKQQTVIIKGYQSIMTTEFNQRYVKTFDVFQDMILLAVKYKDTLDMSWFPTNFF